MERPVTGFEIIGSHIFNCLINFEYETTNSNIAIDQFKKCISMISNPALVFPAVLFNRVDHSPFHARAAFIKPELP